MEESTLNSLGLFFERFGPWAVTICLGIGIVFLYREKEATAAKSQTLVLTIIEKQTEIMVRVSEALKKTEEVLDDMRDEMRIRKRSRQQHEEG